MSPVMAFKKLQRSSAASSIVVNPTESIHPDFRSLRRAMNGSVGSCPVRLLNLTVSTRHRYIVPYRCTPLIPVRVLVVALIEIDMTAYLCVDLKSDLDPPSPNSFCILS